MTGQQDIAELDRRWREFLSQDQVVSDGQVISWLRTWGTSEFKSWKSFVALKSRTGDN
jgi:hypothetical protein